MCGLRQATPILVLTENVTDPGQGAGLAQWVSPHVPESRVSPCLGKQ